MELARQKKYGPEPADAMQDRSRDRGSDYRRGGSYYTASKDQYGRAPAQKCPAARSEAEPVAKRPRVEKKNTANVVYVEWDGVITDTRDLVFTFQQQNARKYRGSTPYPSLEELTKALTNGTCTLFDDRQFLNDLEAYLDKQDPVLFPDALDCLRRIKNAGYEVRVVGRLQRSRLDRELQKFEFTFDSVELGGLPTPGTTGEVFYVTGSSLQVDRAHKHFRECHQKMKVISVTRSLEPALELEHHHTVVCNALEEVADYITTPIGPIKDFSYLLSGYYGCERLQLHKEFRGWKLFSVPKAVSKKYVDYLRLEHSKNKTRDSSLNRIECKLKNVLDESGLRPIINKKRLYDTMKKLFPSEYLEFMPETCDMRDKQTVKEGEVFIVKPVGNGACAGNGISVVTTTGQLYDARRKILDNRNWREGIVSKYITNPLLYKGRKFHFRCYIFVTTWGTFSPYPRADILTASDPYQPAHYCRPEIHDSHGKSTQEDKFFPEDFPDNIERIQAGIDKIMNRITQAIKAECQIKAYSESKNAYEILAPDILFDTDYNPYLLEVNNRVGFGAVQGVNEDYHAWEKGFLKWEYEKIIEPVFKPRDVQDNALIH